MDRHAKSPPSTTPADRGQHRPRSAKAALAAPVRWRAGGYHAAAAEADAQLALVTTRDRTRTRWNWRGTTMPHVLAEAVQSPVARYADHLRPSTEDGFYYDLCRVRAAVHRG